MNTDHTERPEESNATASFANGDQSAADSIRDKDGGDVSPLPVEKVEFASGFRLVLIMFTVLMSTLLTALEIGIIATAIPGITDDFNRLEDVGWYGSATFLLAGPSSPLWGKLYHFVNVKLVFLASFGLYLVGSVVAAAAPNSPSVIVGRALQGLGASGTLSGSALIINYVAKPKSRPMLLGLWMGIFMVSTILGPVIGGAFTSRVSWRWCFWINLPLGGPILLLIVLFLKIPKHIKPAAVTSKELFLQLDLPGFSLLLASLVCMTLALQWGGQTKEWSDGSVIATLVLWLALTICFFIVEWLQGPRAIVPLKLLRPRMRWANALYCYISNSAMYEVIFYLPIYFQSIHGQSAIIGGLNSLPFLAFFAVGAVVSGMTVGKTRLLQPIQLASALLMTAGSALLYTMVIHSSKARYVGSQVLFGFGVGLGNQIPMTAVQAFSSPENVASLTGIMLMCQAISGAYFIVVAQSLFANRMLQTLESIAPSIDPTSVLRIGASDIYNAFSGDDLVAVLDAYMIGIKDVFALVLAGSVLATILAFILPFEKLPAHSKKEKGPSRTGSHSGA